MTLASLAAVVPSHHRIQPLIINPYINNLKTIKTMKAVKVNSYNKISETTGKLVRVHVYKITQATAAELADYQLVQGIRYKTDSEDGSPLFFTLGYAGNVIDLVKGKVKDRTTGTLVDAYRAISSEDFELKRSIYESMAVQINPVPNVAAISANSAKIDVDDTNF